MLMRSKTSLNVQPDSQTKLVYKAGYAAAIVVSTSLALVAGELWWGQKRIKEAKA